MMGEIICGSFGGGASCTEICVHGIFTACNCVVSSSLRSSSDLTSSSSRSASEGSASPDRERNNFMMRFVSVSASR